MTADDVRDWISFDDPTERRTWMFDATFLGSNYQCIFGNGCLGIDPEPDEAAGRGCCSHGAYLCDDDDLGRVTTAVDTLLNKHNWQHHDLIAADTDGPFVKVDGAWKTRIVDGACVFHNDVAFDGTHGCALHSAAAAAGQPPATAKPEVCWQVPIRREDHQTETGHLFTMVREWSRRDWGEGGDEFGWWCTDDDRAFVGHEPAYVTLADDLVRICGQSIYEELVNQMETRLGPEGPSLVLMPHPAVRQRPGGRD